MSDTSAMDDPDALYAGLRELVEEAFPRRCASCGREYASLQAWLAETRALPRGSGLKAGMDDGGAAVVDLFRNCVCGSTLMESFGDRRDTSPAGEARRRAFARLQEALMRHGLDAGEARRELIAARNGALSERLQDIIRKGGHRAAE